jgi:hypothetical protein
MRNTGAYVLRKTTGTSGLDQTLRDAVALLARHVTPHLVVGGLAVREHGYFRMTTNCDIVVSDVFDAVELLTADLSGPFERVPGRQDAVRDKRNGVVIDLPSAGRVLKAGCKVPFPEPQEVCDQPVFVTLQQLIALKLDSWSSSQARRLKDKADVVELIKALRLPRDLAMDEAVRKLYQETWDALAADE